MNFLTQKITTFLVVGLLVMLVGTIAGLLKLTRSGTDGIEGVYLLMSVPVALLLVLLDRFLVQHVPVGWLSALELGVLLGGYGYVAYTSRTTVVDISDNPAPYFVLVWVKNPDEAASMQRVFPFDKTVVVAHTNTIRLDYSEFPRTTVKAPAGWNGVQSRGVSLTGSRFESAYVYVPASRLLTAAEADRLVRQVIN